VGHLRYAAAADGARATLHRFAIGRALAKTITFRVIAPTMDLATNYLAVRDLGSALILSFRLRPRAVRLSRPREDVGVFQQPRKGEDLPELPSLPHRKIFTAGRDMLMVAAQSIAAHRHRHAEYRHIAVYI
jgi:hypothetical protein